MNLGSFAVRNVMRNKTRTALTVLAGAVAVLAFVLLRTVLSAWNVAVDFAAKDRLATRHKVSFIISLPKNYIDVIRGVPGVKSATWASWFGGKDPRDANNFFASMAVDPVSFLDVYDEIGLSPDQKDKWLTDRRGAIIGDVLARKMGLHVGDRVTLTGTIFPGDWQFYIDGIYEAKRKSVDRSQFFFHWNYLNESLEQRRRDEIGWTVARVNDPGQGPVVSAAIDRIFDERDVQTTTMSERAMNLSFMAGASAVLTALNVISFLILAIMMMILGNTIAMGVRERTHEYGALRAIGFLPRHIVFFVVGEALTIGLLGGLLGLALSFPVVEQGMGRWLEENLGGFFPYFRIAPATAVAALALALGVGALASLLPAISASRLSVTDSLRRIG